MQNRNRKTPFATLAALVLAGVSTVAAAQRPATQVYLPKAPRRSRLATSRC